jgi:hypothetical protein
MVATAVAGTVDTPGSLTIFLRSPHHPQAARVDDLTQLLLDAQQGDQPALAAFIGRTHPQVWRLCAP